MNTTNIIMIPKKTVQIEVNDLVDIKAKYGAVAVAVEAANGALTFTRLTEENQLGVESASEWQTDGIPDGKIVYGRFTDIEVSGSNAAWIHIKP